MKQLNTYQGSTKEFIKSVLKNPNAYKTAGLGSVGLLGLLLGMPFIGFFGKIAVIST